MKGNAYIPFMRSRGDGSTLNLDFTGGSLDPRVVLTRSAATATYINSSGYVASAAVNEARFDYDPTTLAAKGLLIEGEAINYMLRSTTLNPHSVTGMRTISTASITDPEGTTNKASIIAADATASYHARFLGTIAGTNTTITVSIFAKKNGYKYLYFADFANGRSAVRFDLDDGTTSNSAGGGFVSASATSYSNGWWRCSMVVTVTASTSYSWSYVGLPTSGATLNAYGAVYNGTNTDSDGIYAYGFQVEGGTGASSYIPTVASQTTRNPDLALMTSTNFSSWFTGGTTGTFFVDWHGGVRGITSTVRSVISTNDQTTKHLHLQQVSAAGVLKVADFGAAHSVSTANSITSGARTKGAFNFDGATTTVNLCLNGGTVATSSAIAFSVAPTWLVLGGTSTDGSTLTDLTTVLNGSIRQIKYYPTALTSAQLIAMTT